MDVSFTVEEIKNSILVLMREIQSNTPAMNEERGVTYDYFLDYTKMEVNDFMNNLDSLIDNGLIHKMDNNRLTLSSKGKALLDEKNAISLTELSSLIIEKAYEIYQRGNENTSMQFNSMKLAIILGISKFDKVVMAIDELYEAELVGKPAKTRYYANFLLSRKGIIFGENGFKTPEKSSKPDSASIIVRDVSGNVAINSDNVNQTIIDKNVSQYFRELEHRINEYLCDKEKEDALVAVATVEELSKAQQPNRNLIQVFLNNLDKIPILIEIVSKIRSALGY
jgi:predicted house-cleaning noncanonical NTP pyrophosphatase (MazG superfamily)